MAPKSNSSGDDNDDLVINVDKDNNAPIQPSSAIETNFRSLFTKGYFQQRFILQSSKGKISLNPHKTENKKRKKKKKKKKKKDIKTFNCTYANCTKVFHEKSSIRKHILTHSERQHKCPIENCFKRFIDNAKLKRHLLVHSGEKQFVCSICRKTFSLDFNLRIHQRIHTGDKPYSCDYPGCFKKFSQSSNLVSHKKLHNDNDSSRKGFQSTLIQEYNLPYLLNNLASNPFVGTFNINNLIDLNRKYENTQLQQYQKGPLKNNHHLNGFVSLIKQVEKENGNMKKIFNIDKEKKTGNRIKAVTIVYDENYEDSDDLENENEKVID